MATGFRSRSMRGVGRAEREEMAEEIPPYQKPSPRKPGAFAALAREFAKELLVAYEDPRVIHLDRARPGVLRDFRELMDKERLRKRLGADSGKPAREGRDYRSWKDIADSGNPAAEAEARMKNALLWLERGVPLGAVEDLENVARAYLNDDNGTIPRELGREALRSLEVISRAWAVASALEYSEMRISDFLPYFRSAKVFAEEGEIHWPLVAIAMLGITGGLSDLPTIGIVARGVKESSTEDHATKASNQIKIMAALEIGLRLLDGAKRDGLGIQDLQGMDAQLAHALKYLFNEMGIARALSMLPSMRKYGQGTYREYIDSAGRCHDPERDALIKLVHEGLSQKVRMLDLSDEYWDITHAAEFLLRHGIIQKVAGTHEYMLSEKGEMLVRAIIAEAVRGEFGERESEIAVEGLPLLEEQGK